MSDHCNSEEHEHHFERVSVTLTPSGLRLNVLGLIGEIFSLLQAEDYEAATDLVDMAGHMLSAAYLGRFELLDDSYETAVVERFVEELDNPDVLASLDKMEEEQ